MSSVEIAKELNITHTSVLDHLRKAGYTKKLDVWVPHELTQKNLLDRISICESLLNRNKVDSFLKRMAGDAPQTVAKPGLTARKGLLCVWWDWRGILYYELLQPGQTLNSDVYCQQLDRLKQAIVQKQPELANRKGVVFHQDNARPHTSLVTSQKLRELGWEVLMHPPYSPDTAPSDYYLFRWLQNSRMGVKLALREACENHLFQFFANRDKDF
ncbi:histone-lysine N-methyltransferase SETMAR-like [Osmia bicornis bicornis]|uniref:histone-lysine N-methyltransferase SETMAR-like n=1 Tax=Osmia bicornis bicornis TaxID=1437191 RepID=UPI001EAEA6B8|nr:histone-lysine N-methyltransferase SETMAR-like [Osmia bicornis bicornis]